MNEFDEIIIQAIEKLKEINEFAKIEEIPCPQTERKLKIVKYGGKEFEFTIFKENEKFKIKCITILNKLIRLKSGIKEEIQSKGTEPYEFVVATICSYTEI
jgi:uncharacterized UPF0160 family protein